LAKELAAWQKELASASNASDIAEWKAKIAQKQAQIKDIKEEAAQK
jgi:hypothetical protein